MNRDCTRLIKLGGADIGVIYDDPSVWASGGMGRSDIIHGNIHIRHDLDSDQVKQTILHELVHVMLDSNGLYEASQNEPLVSVIASQVLSLIRDNPKLIASWRETWTPEEDGGTNPVRSLDY